MMDQVVFEISIDYRPAGTLKISFFEDIFPDGVENFLGISSGETYRTSPSNIFNIDKVSQRSYSGTKFFSLTHDNSIAGGDIYRNNGSDAGTIYDDNGIPFDADELDEYIPHDRVGLVSLVPYFDDDGNKIYDSTFLITLSNKLGYLDNTHVVIGHVVEGLDLLQKINNMLKPFAGKRYPVITIEKSYLQENRY